MIIIDIYEPRLAQLPNEYALEVITLENTSKFPIFIPSSNSLNLSKHSIPNNLFQGKYPKIRTTSITDRTTTIGHVLLFF